MENVKIYSGLGTTIDLALNRLKPREMKIIQKDQITNEVIQRFGAYIAVATLDGSVIHVGAQVNPQFLIREFGWRVDGVEPYKPSSKVARLLDKKKDGLDPRVVSLRLEAEAKAQRDAKETGTSRADVTKLDIKTAKKAAKSVVLAAVQAEAQQAGEVSMPEMPLEPETAPETPEAGDTSSESGEGENVDETQGDEAQDASGEVSDAEPEVDSEKESGKRGRKGKKGK